MAMLEGLPKTGSRVAGRPLYRTENLLSLDTRGESKRVTLDLQGVQKVLGEVAGITFPEEALQRLGFDNIERWEAIYSPRSSNVVIIGAVNNEGSIKVSDATASITILRDHHAGLDGEIVLRSIRVASVIPDASRIVELSYENPHHITPNRRVPKKTLRLSHIGFSVSPDELSESKKTGTNVYFGSSVRNAFEVAYVPTYWTFPPNTNIDILFEHESDKYSGSLITKKMVELAGGKKIRLVRTDYKDENDFAWGSPRHRLYLGGDEIAVEDPAHTSGFYSRIHDDTGHVEFGKIADSTDRLSLSWRQQFKILIPTSIGLLPKN